MAADALHLRVCGIPRDQDDIAALRPLCHDLMNFGYKRAGGVAAVEPAFPDGLNDGCRHAVRAHHEHSALRYLAGFIHDHHTALLQIIHHLWVVDDRAEGINGFPLLQHGVNHADRPVHAEAKARRFCQLYFLHGPSPQSSVIRSIIRREASRSSRVPPSCVMPSSS